VALIDDPSLPGGRHPAGSPPAPTSGSIIRLRFMVLALGIVLWSLVIALRLVQLQLLEHKTYSVRARRQSERTVNLDPKRGLILDRNGRPLAVSVEVESVYADPQNVDDPATTSRALAGALKLSAVERDSLSNQLRRDRAFVWVKRKVDPLLARAVRELRLAGVGFLTETRRYYPKRELAAQLVGYAGMDNTGMWGIEYAFDEELRGRQAKVVVRTDAHRRPVGYTERPSTEGRTVVLTIDEAIQHIVERELALAVKATSSAAGMAVVLDPRSGEILALANRPTFNPNRFWVYNSAYWRNRAVVDAFEPGSVFKVITAAAALEERLVGADEIVDCGHGFIEIAGQRISDHAVFDQLRFRDVIAHSSDVGVARVAGRLGRQAFARHIADFGFGTVTGVELPGESCGLVQPASRWSSRSLATIAFGQEVGVTALQMTSAVAAIANGGYLMKPLIVRQIEDNTGRLLKLYRPVAIRRVIQPETADTLIEILKGVVRYGTGRRAKISGYTVAGKTGTAQKLDASGRYSTTEHIASFVGFVPASRPAVVVMVSLDAPQGQQNQGGDVAAPLFARIAEQTLRRLAVPSEDPSRIMRIARYTPYGATRVSLAGASDGRTALPVSQDSNVMPDLRGHSARQAASVAVRYGLVIELQGSGQVVRQRPLPGAHVAAGDTCVLTLGKAMAESAPAKRWGT
jgi:cell division protein FtsI (penicillin-binding protein 3)